MKTFCVVLFTLFFPFGLYAQIDIDSLKNKLDNAKSDSATIHNYIKEMRKLGSDEKEAALLIGNWALQKSVENKIYHTQALAAFGIGRAYLQSDNFTEATKYFTKAHDVAQQYGYFETEINVLGGLANMYLINQQYAKAIEYHEKAIEASKKNNYKVGLALGYYNLGSVYYNSAKSLKDTLNALKNMSVSIKILEEIKDQDYVGQMYGSIASIYTDIKKFDSASVYLNKGEYFIKKTGIEEYYVTHYIFVGNNFDGLGQYRQAIHTYQLGLSYAQKFNQPQWTYNYATAMAKTYEKLGDYKNANKYNKLYIQVHDSVINKENFSAAVDIQNKYERAKKDKELLQKDLQLKTNSEKRNRLIIYLISSLAILGLMAVLSFLLIRNIKARKKAYTDLEKRNEEIKEQALRLSHQARLIAKFQSQMNPHFTFNALHSIYGLVIGNENEKAVTQIQSLAQLMRKTLTNSIKEEITLEEEMDYLQRYIDFEKATSATAFDFKIQVDEALENVLIPPMMIQPFIENAIKHAGLDKVQNPFIKVLIEKENDLMMLIIEDNGQGLNKDNTNVNKLTHSMSIIKSRIDLLFEGKRIIAGDSYFKILSMPEITRGTAVKFYLPLNYAY